MSTDTAIDSSPSSKVQTKTPEATNQNTSSFQEQTTGNNPVQSVQEKNNVRSFIGTTDPKILAQRFRNMGLINNAERDAVLALSGDKQLEALRQIQQDAENVRMIAFSAIKAGIISHAEHMALFHSANGAADATGHPQRYSLKERVERAAMLKNSLEKIKDKSLTVEQAKKEYAGFNTAQTSPTATQAKETPVVPVNETSPSQPSSTPKQEQPITNTKPPKVVDKHDEPKKSTPTKTEAFITLGDKTKIFTRANGLVYDDIIPGAVEKPENTAILISHHQQIMEFHKSVTEKLFAQDQLIRDALKGKDVIFIFHPDLSKIALKPGETLGRGESFSGVSVVQGDRKNPELMEVYLKPEILRDTPKAMLLVLHELTHISLGIADKLKDPDGKALSKAEEEKAVIQHSMSVLAEMRDSTEDPKLKAGLTACLRLEAQRLKKLPDRYFK